MGNVHTTITFESKSGLPEDRVVNSWSFITPLAPVDFDLLNIESALQAFYNTIPTPAASAVCSWMSNSLSRTVKPTYRHYDVSGALTGAPAGSPVRTALAATTLGATGSTTGLPAEVAAVLSFQAQYGTDVEFGPGTRPRARDRGRVYIGPLTSGVLNSDGTTARVSLISTAQTAIAEAGRHLIEDTGTEWAVWSRAAGVMKPVSSVWVDDAFDTQRRRGQAPLSRLVRP